MRAVSRGADVGSDFFKESVREHVRRLLQFRGFVHARQLSSLLSYTIEETLAGRGAQIKEITIGIDVFGRPPSFDPRVDPIVRVQATKLRIRLKEYYESEGAGEALRIAFPKGGYVPVIETGPPAAPGRVYSRRIWITGLTVLMAAAVLVLALLVRPSTAPPAVHTLAVLPFVSIGSEEEEYFADGLTEELIASLGGIAGLRTVARTSVFEYKGRQQDVRQISARLAADRVLEGSVRWEGSQVRVTAQLIDGQNGYQLWTATYSRERSGLFAVQDALAKDIVAAMRMHMVEDAGAAGRRTPDPEAYLLYLQGRYFWRFRQAEALNKARGYFEKAIARDPGFAAAHAGLADTFSQLAAYELAPLDETRAPALAAARRGAQLGTDSAEAQAALGYALAVFTLDWKNSEEAFRRAIRLNPAYADAHRWLASLCLVTSGRLDEALSEARLAVALDPISVYAHQDLGRVLSARGDYEAAIVALRKAVELAPNHARPHTELGFALERTGDPVSAQRSFEQAAGVSDGHPAYLADLARFYAANGKPAAARRLLERIGGRAGSCHLAAVYAALGETDRAFAELDKAVDSRLLPRVLPNRYDSLRADPRFERVMARLGLTAARSASAGSN
jgi:TolB-like protein/tetratricopeptide (TPR) repeat protein